MTGGDWNEAILFLSAPFAMCLILVGIHCYLGLHVLARGVIFVDLSLAQVAGLGATVALLLGFEHKTLGAYFVSLGLTFFAAGFFALSRRHEKKIPQEAIIGIVYAFASAAVILVVDRLAHGAEHIKEMLVGQILWVTWNDVGRTALIYGFVGFIHYVFRKQLLAASTPLVKHGSFVWDFLFYALFGIVITSSSSMAGVLQVFAYLIVPSVVASAFYKTIKARLLFGWIFGALLSFIALGASHWFDLPAGAFIVVTFTAVPVLLLLLFPKYMRKV
jgi:zinc/manganese transport system permease protein